MVRMAELREGGAGGLRWRSVDEGVDGAAEDGGFADAGEIDGAWARRSMRWVRGLRSRRGGAGRVGVGELLEFGDGADGDQLGDVDVAEPAAALGLVHVVGGDEEGDALAGESEEEVPERAAGDGVDAGGGLVEEDDLAASG